MSRNELQVICFLLCTVVAVVFGKHEKYEGHQLYRVAGPAEDIAALEASLDILTAFPATRDASGIREALVGLSPETKQAWLEYFDSKNMPYIKAAENLAEIIRDEELQNIQAKSAAKRTENSISWDAYYRHNEINDHLDNLGEKYPDLVTVINGGLSYERRLIKYVRISSSGLKHQTKPVIIIDAATHAREWVSPPVALYIINQLVVDVVDKRLTDEIDWVIIPVVNPDGYEYSISEDRMWRKTRSRSHVGADKCPGVDGNRNYDHHWGTSTARANPCTITYEGPAPFSEPEMQVVRDVVLRNIARAKMYISLHSSGNLILYAWGNNGTFPSNHIRLHLAAASMAYAIDQLALREADHYIVGNAARVLYYTTGTSRDWTRAMGIPYTYTLELPGYEYGFLVPPNYTKQIVTETWAGIVAGAKYVLNSGPSILCCLPTNELFFRILLHVIFYIHLK